MLKYLSESLSLWKIVGSGITYSLFLYELYTPKKCHLTLLITSWDPKILIVNWSQIKTSLARANVPRLSLPHPSAPTTWGVMCEVECLAVPQWSPHCPELSVMATGPSAWMAASQTSWWVGVCVDKGVAGVGKEEVLWGDIHGLRQEPGYTFIAVTWQTVQILPFHHDNLY